MMTKEKLKPCPFCGHPAVMIEGSRTKLSTWMFRVGCSNELCCATQGEFESSQNCIETWNNRS